MTLVRFRAAPGLEVAGAERDGAFLRILTPDGARRSSGSSGQASRWPSSRCGRLTLEEALAATAVRQVGEARLPSRAGDDARARSATRPTSCRRCSCRRCSSSSSSRPGHATTRRRGWRRSPGFAVIGVAFFQFGVGIAVDRASPWEAYLRTLPVGPCGPARAPGSSRRRSSPVRAAALLVVTARRDHQTRRSRRGALGRARARRCSPARSRSRSSGSRSDTGRRPRGRFRSRTCSTSSSPTPAGSGSAPPAFPDAVGASLAVPPDAGALRRARRDRESGRRSTGAPGSLWPSSPRSSRQLAVAGYRRDEGRRFS